MRFKNVSPLGDLTVDGVGSVPAGEEFTATGDLAESLLKQPENYERTDAPDDKPSSSKVKEK